MGIRPTAGIVLALMLVCLGLTACSRPDPVLVALLVPTANAERWETIDEPAFRARVEQTCRGCEYTTYSADGDASLQGEQFDEAIDDGADLVVLAAVDAAEAESWVDDTEVPVLAYDRFVTGATYFVSHDTDQIGVLQAQTIVDELDGQGRVLMVNGAVDDPNAAAVKRAAHGVIDASDLVVVDEIDPLTSSAEEAHDWVATALTQAGPRTIDAVYAANDVQAGGVVDALREAGLGGRDVPVVTGQDADLDAVRRLVTGEQTMTVYTSIREQAHQAADIAVAVLAGEEVEGGEDHEGVRAWIFDPQAVSLQTLTDTVVREGLWSIGDICEGAVRARCERLGLS